MIALPPVVLVIFLLAFPGSRAEAPSEESRKGGYPADRDSPTVPGGGRGGDSGEEDRMRTVPVPEKSLGRRIGLISMGLASGLFGIHIVTNAEDVCISPPHVPGCGSDDTRGGTGPNMVIGTLYLVGGVGMIIEGFK